MSKEYADKLQADGKMNQMNQMPLGTGPFTFVAYQQDAVIRYKANADYWGGKQKIDDLVFAITTDAAVRYQKLKAGECHLMPYPNAADVAAIEGRSEPQGLRAGRPERRLPRLQHARRRRSTSPKCARRSTWRSTSRRSSTRVFQGAATAGQEPDPADDVVLQRRRRGRQIRSGSGQGSSRGGRRQGPVDEGLGDAGCASLHAERAPRGRADPGGLRQGRRQGRDRLLRVGRISRASPRPRTATAR